MSDNGQVGQFHHKFGLDNTTYNGVGPRQIPEDLIQFRIKFLCEELQELLEGLGWKFVEGESVFSSIHHAAVRTAGPTDAAQIFDALIDLVYVAHGTSHLLGYPWTEGWSRVQAANMSKVRAERPEQSDRGGTWDIIKPPNFQPPDIRNLLEEYGWYPEERGTTRHPDEPNTHA